MPRKHLPLLVSPLLLALSAACGGDSENRAATASATGTPEGQVSTSIAAIPPTVAPSPTPTLTDAEAQDGSPEALRPGPAWGGPCPVQQEICDTALDLLQRTRAADVDALMAHSVPRQLTCPDPEANTGPGSSADACLGAVEGDTRPAYLVSSGGKGLYVGSDWFRDSVNDAVRLAQTAEPGSSDNYGFGDLRIAAIGCFRSDDAPAGECGPQWIEVTLTFISHDQSIPSTGGPGRRTLCLEMWWPEGATRPGLTGAGCGVPPQAQLYAFDLAATAAGGIDGRFGNYPWTPSPGLAHTYPTGTRTGDPTVDRVLGALEDPSGVLPPDLFEYTWVDCVAQITRLGSPPECPPGVAEGTLVEAVPFSPCEGGWRRRDQIETHPPTLGGRHRPYAVSLGTRAGGTATLLAVGALGLPVTISVGASGISGVQYFCGDTAADAATELAEAGASWLLPPPATN